MLKYLGAKNKIDRTIGEFQVCCIALHANYIRVRNGWPSEVKGEYLVKSFSHKKGEMPISCANI